MRSAGRWTLDTGPDPLFVPTDEVVKKFLQTVFPRMKSFKSDTIAIYIITDVYTKMRRGMWAQRPIPPPHSAGAWLIFSVS